MAENKKRVEVMPVGVNNKRGQQQTPDEYSNTLSQWADEQAALASQKADITQTYTQQLGVIHEGIQDYTAQAAEQQQQALQSASDAVANTQRIRSKNPFVRSFDRIIGRDMSLGEAEQAEQDAMQQFAIVQQQDQIMRNRLSSGLQAAQQLYAARTAGIDQELAIKQLEMDVWKMSADYRERYASMQIRWMEYTQKEREMMFQEMERSLDGMPEESLASLITSAQQNQTPYVEYGGQQIPLGLVQQKMAAVQKRDLDIESLDIAVAADRLDHAERLEDRVLEQMTSEELIELNKNHGVMVDEEGVPLRQFNLGKVQKQIPAAMERENAVGSAMANRTVVQSDATRYINISNVELAGASRNQRAVFGNQVPIDVIEANGEYLARTSDLNRALTEGADDAQLRALMKTQRAARDKYKTQVEASLEKTVSDETLRQGKVAIALGERLSPELATNMLLVSAYTGYLNGTADHPMFQKGYENGRKVFEEIIPEYDANIPDLESMSDQERTAYFMQMAFDTAGSKEWNEKHPGFMIRYREAVLDGIASELLSEVSVSLPETFSTYVTDSGDTHPVSSISPATVRDADSYADREAQRMGLDATARNALFLRRLNVLTSNQSFGDFPNAAAAYADAAMLYSREGMITQDIDRFATGSEASQVFFSAFQNDAGAAVQNSMEFVKQAYEASIYEAQHAQQRLGEAYGSPENRFRAVSASILGPSIDSVALTELWNSVYQKGLEMKQADAQYQTFESLAHEPRRLKRWDNPDFLVKNVKLDDPAMENMRKQVAKEWDDYASKADSILKRLLGFGETNASTD